MQCKNIGGGASAKFSKDFKFHEIIDDSVDNGDNIKCDGPFLQLESDIIQQTRRIIM